MAAREGTGGYAAEQSEAYEQKQRELVSRAIASADVVITTALVPGRRAPRLVTAGQVASMRPGSVIVDLAAEQGGNVEGCEPGVDVERNGVTIIGARSPASNVALHASTAFSRNIEKLLRHLTRGGQWQLDFEDEVTAGCVITRDGEVAHARVRELLERTEPEHQPELALAQGA
jgi:NAD(P) transhydrogenase subunit alpha